VTLVGTPAALRVAPPPYSGPDGPSDPIEWRKILACRGTGSFTIMLQRHIVNQ